MSRLLYAFLFDFLFGRHFAISIDCCYYLAHLWYCNGFHCQGQITATQCSYLFEAFIIYISFVWLWLLLLWSSFDMCKLVTTVSIRFIRYEYMKPTWNDTVQRREFLLIFFLLHRIRTEAFLSPSITRSLYPIFKASMPIQHKNRFCHRTKSMACNVVLLRVHSNQLHHTDYDLCLVNWLSSPIANWVSPVTAHFG